METTQSKNNRTVEYPGGIKVSTPSPISTSRTPKPVSKKLNPQLLQRIIAKSAMSSQQKSANNEAIKKTRNQISNFQNQSQQAYNKQQSKQIRPPSIRTSDFGNVTPRSQISEKEVSILNVLREKASFLIAINEQSVIVNMQESLIDEKNTATYNFQSFKRRLMSQFKQSSTSYMKEEMFNEILEDYFSELMLKQSDYRIDELDRYKKQLKESLEKNSILTKKLQQFQKDTTNKSQLSKKLKINTIENKALEERLTALDKVLKRQNDSFKQSQDKANQQIQYLNTQLKSSHTKQFNKLNQNNKQLIQQNIRLKQQIQFLEQQIKAEKTKMHKIMKDVEVTRNQMLEEVKQIMEVKLALEKRNSSTIRHRESLNSPNDLNVYKNQFPQYSSKALSPISSKGNLALSSSPKQVYQDALTKMSQNLEQVIDLSSNKIFKILLDDDSITLQPQDVEDLQKLYPGMSRQQVVDLRDKIASKSLEKNKLREFKKFDQAQLRKGKQIVFEEEEEEQGGNNEATFKKNLKQRQSSTPELKALRDKLIKLKVQSEIQSMRQKMERQNMERQRQENKVIMNKKDLAIQIQSPSDFSNYGTTGKQTEQVYQSKQRDNYILQSPYNTSNAGLGDNIPYSNFGIHKQMQGRYIEQQKQRQKDNKLVGEPFPFYLVAPQVSKRSPQTIDVKEITMTSQSANQNETTNRQPQAINIGGQEDFLRRLQENYGQYDNFDRDDVHNQIDNLNNAFDEQVKNQFLSNNDSENLYPAQSLSEKLGQFQKREDVLIAQSENQFRKGVGLNVNDQRGQRSQRKGYQEIEIDYEEEGDNIQK